MADPFLHTIPAWRWALTQTRRDLRATSMRVLLVAAKHNRAGGGRLALAALRDNVREVFEISGFSAIFALHPTVAAAVTALG